MVRIAKIEVNSTLFLVSIKELSSFIDVFVTLESSGFNPSSYSVFKLKLKYNFDYRINTVKLKSNAECER